MSTPPENAEVVRHWLTKAANDLKNAENTLATLPDPDCPLDTVCFHAQQCAEKALKALLISRGIPIEKTHNIGQLLYLCKPGSAWVEKFEGVEKLTHYAVDSRYADSPSEEIDRQEAVWAVALAERVFGEVRRQLASFFGPETPRVS